MSFTALPQRLGGVGTPAPALMERDGALWSGIFGGAPCEGPGHF